MDITLLPWILVSGFAFFGLALYLREFKGTSAFMLLISMTLLLFSGLSIIGGGWSYQSGTNYNETLIRSSSFSFMSNETLYSCESGFPTLNSSNSSMPMVCSNGTAEYAIANTSVLFKPVFTNLEQVDVQPRFTRITDELSKGYGIIICLFALAELVFLVSLNNGKKKNEESGF